ncbi:hypothetical protein [Agrobacterium cavarae]|uniref:hypothetical protein n=1 Tax=Agrobacterium cavarae TaxID=2528239 RepID=UPI003FD104BF
MAGQSANHSHYRVMGDAADIATTIRRMRLHAIHRDIVAKEQGPLTTIGKRWGLTDERNFRRAFVQEFR